LDPGKDIDILVLAPEHALLGEGTVDPTFAGVGFGAECEFLGFSYGGGWKAQMNKGWVWLPYFNLCTVSALVTESDIKIWV
jgi:hypothetical protein